MDGNKPESNVQSSNKKRSPKYRLYPATDFINTSMRPKNPDSQLNNVLSAETNPRKPRTPKEKSVKCVDSNINGKSNAQGPTVPKAGEKVVVELTEEEKIFLESECVVVLKQRHARFIHAVFACEICSHHLETISGTRKHCLTSGHRAGKREKYFIESLLDIPEPSETHIAVLDNILNRLADTYCRSATDYEKFDRMTAKLTALARKVILNTNDCYVRMYGSCQSRFALNPTSNLNLELVCPEEHVSLAQSLIKFTETIYNMKSAFSEVAHDFSFKYPYVTFRFRDCDQFSDIKCVLSIRNKQAFLIGEFFQTLSLSFPNLQRMAVVWRLWAKTCGLDSHIEGGLPVYVYDLMLVHFLQQLKPPLIPVIHERAEHTDDRAPYDLYDRNRSTIIEEWQKQNPDDPKWNFGRIFIGLLRYLTLLADSDQNIICVRSKEAVLREAKGWNRRKICVEDPFMPLKNVAQLTAEMYIYFFECLSRSYLYFGVPQTALGPLFVFEDLRLKLNKFFENGSPNNRLETTTPPKTLVPHVGEHLTGQQLIFRQVVLASSSPIVAKNNTTETNDKSPKENSKNLSEVCGNLAEKEIVLKNNSKCGKSDEQVQNSESSLTRKERKALRREKVELVYPHLESTVLNGLITECVDQLREIQESTNKNNDADSEVIDDKDEQLFFAEIETPLEKSEKPQTAYSRSALLTVGKSVVKNPVKVYLENFQKAAINRKAPCVLSARDRYFRAARKHVLDLFDLMLRSENLLDSPDESNVSIVDPVQDTAPELEKENHSDEQKPCSSSETTPSPSQEINSSETAKKTDNQKVPSNNSLPRNEILENPAEKSARLEKMQQAAFHLNSEHFMFRFLAENFLGPLEKPNIICESCGEDSHLATYCTQPAKKLGSPPPLTPISILYVQMQDYLLQNLYRAYRMSRERLTYQEAFRHHLEDIFKQSISPDVRLYLFGSSCNGFGFNISDLDLCFVFKSQENSHNLSVKKIIRQIASILKQDKNFTQVMAVTQAKVPIVKFYHKFYRLDGDVSLYNVLALRNTHLMYSYSLIDERVKILGYLVKVFVKYMDIGDASKGSLSSYAYIIMVIHYLQNCQPPVLPVLQQCGTFQSHVVDGWETYFFSDIANLRKYWVPMNTMSVVELWIGFFRYYTEMFDYRNYVIQIRLLPPNHLAKLEKAWTDKVLAIEDPFELSHNLASGISRKMFVYIQKVFRNARIVFGDARGEKDVAKRLGFDSVTMDKMEDYFFNQALKLQEEPPKDRTCRLCSRVGHFVETCPMNRKNARKVQDDDEDQTQEVTVEETEIVINNEQEAGAELAEKIAEISLENGKEFRGEIQKNIATVLDSSATGDEEDSAENLLNHTAE